MCVCIYMCIYIYVCVSVCNDVCVYVCTHAVRNLCYEKSNDVCILMNCTELSCIASWCIVMIFFMVGVHACMCICRYACEYVHMSEYACMRALEYVCTVQHHTYAMYAMYVMHLVCVMCGMRWLFYACMFVHICKPQCQCCRCILVLIGKYYNLSDHLHILTVMSEHSYPLIHSFVPPDTQPARRRKHTYIYIYTHMHMSQNQ